ncbi:MAG TPA: endonuclease/exonuclease/phosphatase family protein [Humisphaera sp.]
MPLRVVSYNILDGGTGRADQIAAVIERQRPDLVALVEADDAGVVAELARRLKMDFVRAVGPGDASALLSRWTIRQSTNRALLDPAISKSFLEAIVVTPRGQPLPVGVLHLHPRAFEADEQARERELAAVLKAFAKHRERGTPHLLCGDFNANHPTQVIDLERARPKTVLAWDANGGMIPRRVVQTLLDAGYVDTLSAARGNDADTTYTFTTDHPGQRVDYAFAWGVPAERVRDAWVEQGDPAASASDHYPVGAELRVED